MGGGRRGAKVVWVRSLVFDSRREGGGGSVPSGIGRRADEVSQR